MEYLEGRTTTMRHVVRKVGLYDLKVVSPWGHYFQTGGPAYDSRPLIEFPSIFIHLTVDNNLLA